MEFSAGRVGSSPLSVPAEAETQAGVTRSLPQPEPKANFDRPKVACHRRLRRRRDGGSRVKENELMGALQTELMRPG